MRGTWTRRRGALAVVAAVAMAAGIVPAASADGMWGTNPLRTAVTAQHHLCGVKDLPEEGIQGDVSLADQRSGRAQQGYNCGLELLGHLNLGKDGRPNVNANMAWAGHCAYISSSAGVSVAPQVPSTNVPGSGVAVVSVAPDGTPTYVATLRSPGALATAETINAVTTPEGRSILVVGQYGNDVISGRKPMDVYDISDPDCGRFKRIPNAEHPHDASWATYYWPTNIHNLTITQDGKLVFATLPLQAVDISGLWDANPRTGIRYLGNLQSSMAGPPVATGPMADLDDALPASVRNLTRPNNASHEAWPSPDGSTLYVGGQTPEFEIFSILDLRQWLKRTPDGRPAGPIRVVSQESGRGHSVRTATIGGKPYVLHSEESVFGLAYGCIPQEAGPFAGPAQPWLTDVSDPAHPRTVSQFGLDINDPTNCVQQLRANENDSVHYHDVDDPTDTTFVMASMWNAGIRVFDVRHPEKPAEVAYFNPGDVDPSAKVLLDHAWGHVRYVRESGQIWFATADGGFWVVRVEPQVRSYLGLDAKAARHGVATVSPPAGDAGRPGTRGVALPRALAGQVDLAPWYCTLGAALGGLGAPVQGVVPVATDLVTRGRRSAPG